VALRTRGDRRALGRAGQGDPRSGSTGTIERRFAAIGVESTAETHRTYRNLLFTTPGVEAYLSGAILFDETIHQAASGGVPFPWLLAQRGIIPGIKVDLGAKALAGAPSEKVTEGLDGLRERLAEYRELGARFTKWRAVIAIGSDLPTDHAISVNAHAMGRFAALSQEAGLVPIVEPEVLMDGEHTIEESFEATSRTLEAVFDELIVQRIVLEATLLKPTWSWLVTPAVSRLPTGRWRAGRSARSAAMCQPLSQGSCSCPADRATGTRRRISTH
jgi:fructose-bisphosphate aldolase class I